MTGVSLHRPRNWVLLCALLSALSGWVLGQTSAEPAGDLGDASLAQLMNVEVYSASKHLQSVREAPAFVTVITAEDIRNYGYRTLAEVLQSVPGFYVTYDYQYNDMGMRGYMRTSDYNTPFLLLIDGHRANDGIFENAALGRELPLDVDLIERVEVIRGPSSSLYGANAVFGVINVVTRRGRDLRGMEVSADAGSFGTGKGRITYGNTLQRWEILLSGSFYGSVGETLFFPAFDSPQTNNGIARGVDDESADDFMMKLSHGHFTFQGVYGLRGKGIPTAPYGSGFDDPRARSTDEAAYGDLSYDRSFGPWALAGRISLNHYRFDQTIPYPDGSPTVNATDLLGQWWGGEFKLSRAVLQKHLLTGGVDFRDNFRQNQLNYDLNPYTSFLSHDGSSALWALYIQDEFAVSRKLTVNLAVRHDHYESLMATDPRLAVIFHPWEHTSFKAVAGRAFRAPSAYELYFASPLNEANPTLRGEAVRSGELIVEQGLSKRLRVTTSFFKSWMQGLITSAVDPSSGKAVLLNNDSVSVSGIETQLDGKLENGIAGRASYTFSDADDKFTPGPLASSPAHLAKLNLTVPFLRRRLLAGWESQYTSRRLTLGGNYLGGFVVSNLTLSARNLGQHTDLSFSLYNLFDKNYAQPGGPGMLQDALKQQGRSFRIKVGYKF